MADAASAPPSLNTDIQLQVGVEIEFVAPPDTAWEDAHLPGLDRQTRTSLGRDACHHRLAGAIHNAGLPACYQMTTAPLQCPHNPLCDAAPPDAIVVLGGRYRLFGNPLRLRRRDGPAGLFRYWLVKPERGLTDFPTYRAWIDCELNTPLLTESDVGAGLGVALAALHGADVSAAPHIDPRRCGLHVHLSPDVPGGCTVAYAQRVLTLALLLDQTVLYPLCDQVRRDLVQPFPCTATLQDFVPRTPTRRQRSTRLFSLRARVHLPPAFAAAEACALALIWRDDAMWDDLQQIVEHQDRRADPRRTVAPILCKHKPALGGRGRGRANTTIEFRQAQASFSYRFVRKWARLVLAIGRIALLPVDEYREALGRLGEAAATGDGEGASMAVLRELSAVAVKAGMAGGGLDLAYWRVRYDQMRAGRNPDIDVEGRAVLDVGRRQCGRVSRDLSKESQNTSLVLEQDPSLFRVV